MASDRRETVALASKLERQALLAEVEGDIQRSIELSTRAVEVCNSIQDQRWAYAVPTFTAELKRRQGDFAAAAELITKAMNDPREANSSGTRSSMLVSLAVVYLAAGDLEKSRDAAVQSREIAKRLNRKAQLADVDVLLAAIDVHRGDMQSAMGLVRGIHWKRLSVPERLCSLLEAASCATAGAGEPTDAARLFGAAAAQRARFKVVGYTFERPPVERAIDALKLALGEEEFQSAFEEGKALSLEDAFAFAGIPA